MTLRQRLERLEGPKVPEDEAAIDAEIRRLLHELGARDGGARVQRHEGSRRTPEEEALDAEIQALLDGKPPRRPR